MATATVPTDRRPIGFWLKLVDRLLDEGFDRLLGDRGLTRRHWQALTALQDGPATVGELDTRLAPFLDDQEPSTRPVLDDLAARGWATWAAGDRAAATPAGTSPPACWRRSRPSGAGSPRASAPTSTRARWPCWPAWPPTSAGPTPAATPGAERRPAQPGWSPSWGMVAAPWPGSRPRSCRARRRRSPASPRRPRRWRRSGTAPAPWRCWPPRRPPR